MCMMCEGFSQEDVIAHDVAMIKEYGYLVSGVGSDEPPNWAYTVGLLDLVGHPELIVAGPSIVSSTRLINQIVALIRRGRRFAVGDSWASPEGTARFGAVDPIQYRLNTFNVWHSLKAHAHLDSNDLQALQVFAPRSWFCACHADIQPDLSRPESRVDVAPLRPNRAARRAQRP